MARTRKSTATKPDTRYLDDASQKALADRLARLEGHLRSVRQMVVDRRCADEILLQLAAVKAALNKFSATLLEHELNACVEFCMKGGKDDRLERTTKVFATLLKQT